MLLAATLLGACGSSAARTKSSTAPPAGATAVKPFSDVQASDIRFEPDPNDPSREILHVTTKVPTICAVVWGSDQTFGPTEWATKGDGNEASITLDLGSVTDVEGAEFVTRSMADGSATTSTYTVSVDGAGALGPFPATPANAQPAAFSAHGRTITFHVTKTSGGNVGAAETRFFA